MASRVKRVAEAPPRITKSSRPEAATTARATGTEMAKRDRPLRPGQCRDYMRRELAREFRGIVQGFVKSAKAGNCQHVKLATELLKAPPKRRAKGKGTIQQLLEQLDREEEQAAAAQAAAGQAALTMFRTRE